MQMVISKSQKGSHPAHTFFHARERLAEGRSTHWALDHSLKGMSDALQELIRANMDELAAAVTLEQGKTLADAKGDVFRGLEVVEQACGMGQYQMGDIMPNVSAGIDSYALRQPLGVSVFLEPLPFLVHVLRFHVCAGHIYHQFPRWH
jgi:hypothetical protein